MHIQTKICGVSTPEALDAAISSGATHIGFNFVPRSPRYIAPYDAAPLVQRLPAHIKAVAVVVNEDMARIEAIRTESGIDIIQLHGSESPEFAASLGGEVWKALPVKTREELEQAHSFRGAVQRILYDAKPPAGAELTGGTGLRIDWPLLAGFDHPLPWVLAGGLDPSNVAAAIRISRANFVDVSSGVESAPGIKDVDKIAAFLKAASS